MIPIKLLTEKELEVLIWKKRGAMLHKIADEVGLSLNGVVKSLSRVYDICGYEKCGKAKRRTRRLVVELTKITEKELECERAKKAYLELERRGRERGIKDLLSE